MCGTWKCGRQKQHQDLGQDGRCLKRAWKKGVLCPPCPGKKRYEENCGEEEEKEKVVLVMGR